MLDLKMEKTKNTEMEKQDEIGFEKHKRILTAEFKARPSPNGVCVDAIFMRGSFAPVGTRLTAQDFLDEVSKC